MVEVMLAASTWVSDLCFSWAYQNGEKEAAKMECGRGRVRGREGARGYLYYFCSAKASQSPDALQSVPLEGLTETRQRCEAGG